MYIIYEEDAMEFEYDEHKSATNKMKHGINFEEAQEPWDSITVAIPTKSGNDPERQLVLGTIRDKHWSAIITHRGSRIRIISVRRSRKEEEAVYEQLRK